MTYVHSLIFSISYIPGFHFDLSYRAPPSPRGAQVRQPYHHHVPTVLKSGGLKLLEPSGPVQACNEIALPIFLPLGT